MVDQTPRRTFGPTLEFERLPTLGSDDRHHGRGRVWRRTLVCLGGFWVLALGVAVATWVA